MWNLKPTTSFATCESRTACIGHLENDGLLTYTDLQNHVFKVTNDLQGQKHNDEYEFPKILIFARKPNFITGNE